MTGPPTSVAIVSAMRTPIGKFGGALREIPAVTLGTIAVREALTRAGLPPAEVPFVVMGHCIQAGTGQNPARQVLRGVGIPDRAGAYTVNMVCGSGMQAIISAAAAIRAGDLSVAVAGGMESMSSTPFLLPARARWGLRFGAPTLDDAVLRDSLLDAYGEHEHMGMTGERVAQHFGISRAEADRFALRSHLAATRANADGTFASETAPVPIGNPGGPAALEHDEGPGGTPRSSASAASPPRSLQTASSRPETPPSSPMGPPPSSWRAPRRSTAGGGRPLDGSIQAGSVASIRPM